MKGLVHIYIILVALALSFVSCSRDMEVGSIGDGSPIVLRGIHADIDNGSATRAVAPLVDSIGRYDFLGTDEIVFTTIERTKHPIPGFSYSGVKYSCAISGSGDKRNISWTRYVPETDIFWSDGSEPHTFVGYILPHNDSETAQASGYDWHYDREHNVYYGSIGNPTDNNDIDYTVTPVTGEGANSPYSHEKLRKEDLLLTYSTEMQNEDAVAWVHFHHGLASVRVVVTITGFSSTGRDPDAETKVTDLVLLNQPTMYKWDNHSYRAAPLVSEDQTVLNGFTDWGGATPRWDQKKSMKLWQPREYRGSGSSRTFTFYGIVAPGNQDQVDMTFKVTYPDPLDPKQQQRLEKTYTATLQLPDSRQVEFRPGYCTSINVNLNHRDEKMTVGAEYMSWQLDDNPDEGSLRKGSTFLSYTDRNKITILGDDKATADDATWLYLATSGKIVDIYGNDGSTTNPFLIKTADQLLSFAYEVKGTSRKAVNYQNLSSQPASFAAGAGFDFAGYNVKLDADITLQATTADLKHDGSGFYTQNSDGDRTSATGITWPGIGDAGHPFNGYFNGGFRHINKLYGKSFFNTIGTEGIVDHIYITDAIGITGSGSIAEKNRGIICGSHVEGDIVDETVVEYCGSIVGINTGVLIACSHIGSITGKANILGAFLGQNDGILVTCYNVGDAKNTNTGRPAFAGVGDYTERSIAYCCYFNQDFYTSDDYSVLEEGHMAFPLNTYQMQSNVFVNQRAEIDDSGNVIGGEIIDGRGPRSDPFFFHLSLNAGLRRAIALLSAVKAIPEAHDGNGNIIFHKGATGSFAEMPLKESQVDWLISHYKNESHTFQFVPGTYPRLQ